MQINLVSAPVLKGKDIELRPFGEAHLTTAYVGWLNDPVVCRDNRHGGGYTMEKARVYLAGLKDKIDYVFAVHYGKNSKHVGNVSLSGISKQHHSAEIAILLGDRAVWGKGAGYEACRLVLDFGFKTVGLHRIRMGMTARNKAMIRIAEKLSMRHEGTLKEAFFKDGQYLDIVEYAVLNKK